MKPGTMAMKVMMNTASTVPMWLPSSANHGCETQMDSTIQVVATARHRTKLTRTGM